MDYQIFFERAKKAATGLSFLSGERINEILISIGENVIKEMDKILSENQKDLDKIGRAHV